ncbi:hypothetical protein [Paenibacillus xerothermodurans]|uniref:Uncharacterized protein n=1 Tax=Paenibacillus xerothermodurans TaxID=1977292 RepID=A0A2W1N4H6_PAEXE|nr:hypothetical protein [Paenibacillus xerothermodurans]PZE19257.1 hypothetical protein CBW46_019415 [Paenibacillus xerothermodurans]
MKIRFDNKEIPVTFLSSDHKMIPQLIQALHIKKGADQQNGTFDLEALDHIEVIGTEAYLYAKTNDTEATKTYLALY